MAPLPTSPPVHRPWRRRRATGSPRRSAQGREARRQPVRQPPIPVSWCSGGRRSRMEPATRAFPSPCACRPSDRPRLD